MARTYNVRLQLTSITGGGRNINYNYDNAANNGQLFSQVENGETVAYQYDSLKRLISATASGSMTWTQSYGYDGFGNLLSKTGSGNGGAGGPVSASYTINSATNRPFSGYTAAGLPTNSGFDNDNRMISTVSTTGYSEYFAYSPGGKRVWNLGTRQIDQFTQGSVQEVWFWSPQGQRLAFYSLTHAGAPVFTFQEANLYLGGKLVGQYNSAGAHILKTSDRLGSFGKYYPYGEERNPTGASGEKFATYFHDNVVGLNYADQRWHANSGRFLTPDPYQASGGPADPGSWNRYAYVRGDPANRRDRMGLQDDPPEPEPPGPGPLPLGLDTNPGGDLEDPQSVPPKTSGDEMSWEDYWYKLYGNILSEAIEDALKALDESRCRNMFGVFEPAMDPRDVLRGLRTGDRSFGHFQFGVIRDSQGRPMPGVVATAATGFVPIGEPNAGNRMAVITINVSSSFIKVGHAAIEPAYRRDRAATILHELAHAFGIIPGAGFATVLPDGRDANASQFNTEQIKRNCFQ